MTVISDTLAVFSKAVLISSPAFQFLQRFGSLHHSCIDEIFGLFLNCNRTTTTTKNRYSTDCLIAYFPSLTQPFSLMYKARRKKHPHSYNPLRSCAVPSCIPSTFP